MTVLVTDVDACSVVAIFCFESLVRRGCFEALFFSNPISLGIALAPSPIMEVDLSRVSVGTLVTRLPPSPPIHLTNMYTTIPPF